MYACIWHRSRMIQIWISPSPPTTLPRAAGPAPPPQPPVLLFLMDPRGLKKVILLSSSREKNYRLYTVITVDWLPAGSFSLNTPAGVSDSSRPVHPGPSAGPVLRLDGG